MPRTPEKDSAESRRGATARRVTLLGVGVNLILSLIKFAAGTLGRSQSLIADAVHSLSDLITDAVVLIGVRWGSRGPDNDHHFGHGRIETMASAAVGAILIITAVGLGYDAAAAFYSHTPGSPTPIALIAAFISIISKEALFRYTFEVGKKLRSSAVIANAWHHRSDALSSFAVLLGVGASLLEPSWRILDALAALFVAFLIARVGAKTIWEALREISDAAPPPSIMKKIEAYAEQASPDFKLCAVRARYIGGGVHLQLCLILEPTMTIARAYQLTETLRTKLQEQFPQIDEIVIQLRPTSS